MIFVTVGTQLPFDRLIRTIDEWAADSGRSDIFAQIGPGTYRPRNFESAPFITADEFDRRTRQASVLVAHAGMGSIISALELGKPILVMPRRSNLGEHRNNHQVATANQFLAMGRINVAFDERELLDHLNRLDELTAGGRISHVASPRLLRTLREFVGVRPATAAVAAAASVRTNDRHDEYAWTNTDYLPRPAVPAARAVDSDLNKAEDAATMGA